MSCITLLTDFGTQDEYVGVMKGVILSVCPRAAIVDICHDIPPQNIRAAGRMVAAAFPHFPPGTIHVAVVDPGVGTSRAVLAGRMGAQLFLRHARRQGARGNLPAQTPDFLEALERELGSSVGAATAHAMVGQITGGMAISVEDLMAVADAGGLMPPKSTWFEPKLRDGMFSHLLAD